MNNQITPDLAEQAQPDLVITITGRTMSGKSTLALFFAMCLEQAGIKDVLIDEQEHVHADMAETFTAKLKGVVAQQPSIVINMSQLKRDKTTLILPPSAKLSYPEGVR